MVACIRYSILLPGSRKKQAKSTSMAHFMHLWASAFSPLLLPVLGASGPLPSVSYMLLQILPLPQLPSCDLLARNRPGPADPVFPFPSHFSPDSLIASCSHLPLLQAPCLPTLPLIHPFPSGSAFSRSLSRIFGRRSEPRLSGFLCE